MNAKNVRSFDMNEDILLRVGREIPSWEILYILSQVRNMIFRCD
jgi:hypothetical protein